MSEIKKKWYVVRAVSGKEKKVKELLQEYLKRIIVQKPEDPLAFLLENIKEKPFTPPVSDN